MYISMNYFAIGICHVYHAEFRYFLNENNNALIQHQIVCRVLSHSSAHFIPKHCQVGLLNPILQMK